jgi:UDP-N-acetylglucosamine--N-acetylmuramyl-(pentapeptide) pyrophosphoryl-undecaprenol N-acetylglucosamine transferase
MKILITGGGTGGHFYPLVAVAEKINEIAEKDKIFDLKIYYMSTTEYDKRALFEQGINFVSVPAGKKRMYSSVKNFFDIFKMGIGVLIGIVKMFFIFPDVVFAKGGYASYPALFAARVFGIPIVIHESDAAPGRVNVWAGKFADRIAISYPEAIDYFEKKDHVAWTGQPVRTSIQKADRKDSMNYLGFDESVPTILILGGSQGADMINNVVLDCLLDLLPEVQIIHQTGEKHYEDVKGRANMALSGNPFASRYRSFAFLNPVGMRMSAGGANLVVTRAGSTLFEIAGWGIPAVVVPFAVSNNDHSRKNAYSYARAGAGIVVEEGNLTKSVFLQAIFEVIKNPAKAQEMSEKAKAFLKPGASELIAREIIHIAESHEK